VRFTTLKDESFSTSKLGQAEFRRWREDIVEGHQKPRVRWYPYTPSKGQSGSPTGGSLSWDGPDDDCMTSAPLADTDGTQASSYSKMVYEGFIP
jgi:hypothetical protein